MSKRLRTDIKDRQELVNILKEYYHETKYDDLYEKILTGENPSEDFLRSLGFSYWDIRNLQAFIHTGNEVCLEWE